MPLLYGDNINTGAARCPWCGEVLTHIRGIADYRTVKVTCFNCENEFYVRCYRQYKSTITKQEELENESGMS